MTKDEESKVADIIKDMATHIESLQRENEELRADVKREAELATHMANDCNDAQAEVKRLREALERFLPYYDAEYVPNTLFDIARTALASTGGEHNADK